MTASSTTNGLLDAYQQKRVDREALLMMLSYIEAECRRLGALESARHAAMAAALLPENPQPAMPGPRGLQ